MKLFEGKPREIINTYTEAAETVDPKIASGKPHTLWCEFAKFYEQNDQIEDVSKAKQNITCVSGFLTYPNFCLYHKHFLGKVQNKFSFNFLTASVSYSL